MIGVLVNRGFRVISWQGRAAPSSSLPYRLPGLGASTPSAGSGGPAPSPSGHTSRLPRPAPLGPRRPHLPSARPSCGAGTGQRRWLRQAGRVRTLQDPAPWPYPGLLGFLVAFRLERGGQQVRRRVPRPRSWAGSRRPRRLEKGLPRRKPRVSQAFEGARGHPLVFFSSATQCLSPGEVQSPPGIGRMSRKLES